MTEKVLKSIVFLGGPGTTGSFILGAIFMKKEKKNYANIDPEKVMNKRRVAKWPGPNGP